MITQTPLFVDVILPIPIPHFFTYRVPFTEQHNAIQGIRVMVPFGKKRILTGIIYHVHTIAPKKYLAKDILAFLEVVPSVNALQIKLLLWVAQYYMCTLGEVVRAALPSGLKVSNESNVQLHPLLDQVATKITFSEKEIIIIEALKKNGPLSYQALSKALAGHAIYNILKSLLTKDAVIIFESIKEQYQPKRTKKIYLHPVHTANNQTLSQLFQLLEKKTKQLDVLLKYITIVTMPCILAQSDHMVKKKKLLATGISRSSLHTLISNNIFIEEEVIESRITTTHSTSSINLQLSNAQQIALDAIQQQFLTKDTVLLQGITGSGKTEIYSVLIKEILKKGGQVLYLLPEIALTTQMVIRLRKIFGNQLGVYHSKYADNERVEVWNSLLNGHFSLIVGVRSAVFLPFDNLQLIVVDEEHEIAYKQFDPAPRYNARDTAIVLAKYHQAKVILGSATPSLESYYNATNDKYGLIQLKERFSQVALPTIEVINIRIEKHKKRLQGPFSLPLLNALNTALKKKEQVIIFQNRRGYAPYLMCEGCDEVATCTRCAVSLTYHQYKHYLCCHYCGYTTHPLSKCTVCGTNRMVNQGFGTEQLETTLKNIFPETCIQRMDLDTTRGKYSYEKIIHEFSTGKTDVLIGTQMITKGLDFSNVSFVGILDVDRLVHFPDFRAHERCFQLITQVGGRAGRRQQQGHVMIQSAHPTYPLFHKIIAHDYISMYQEELAERKALLYPPYSRLIKLTFKHRDEEMVIMAANTLVDSLKKQWRKLVLGPQAPPVAKVNHQYLIDSWIKIKKNKEEVATAKKILQKKIITLWNINKGEFKNVKVVINVDPL